MYMYLNEVGRIELEKLDGDSEKHMWLTGIDVLEDERIAVVDRTNKLLKVVNVKKDNETEILKLSSDPYDVAVIPGDRIAITFPTLDKIQLVSTKGPLELLDTIDVDGNCFGICCEDDILAVTFFRPNKLQLMSLEGEVIKSIPCKRFKGLTNFYFPYYVTAGKCEGETTFYVSSNGNGVISKISKTGNMISTHKIKDLDEPNGITAIGEGRLIVCDTERKKLVFLEDDGESLKKIGIGSANKAQAAVFRHGKLFVTNDLMFPVMSRTIVMYELNKT